MIVGKRALPAIGLAGRGVARSQVDAVAEPDDIAIAYEADDAETRDALRARAGAGA